MRVCSSPACPVLLDKPGRCTEHQREHEQQRGTRQQRGYDAAHDRLRAQWGRAIATGRARCSRCHQAIKPNHAWDLGHNDDRTRHTGPEHATCNRSAGGRLTAH